MIITIACLFNYFSLLLSSFFHLGLIFFSFSIPNFRFTFLLCVLFGGGEENRRVLIYIWFAVGAECASLTEKPGLPFLAYIIDSLVSPCSTLFHFVWYDSVAEFSFPYKILDMGISLKSITPSRGPVLTGTQRSRR